MLLWAKIVPLLVALAVQAQERVVDLTPKRKSDGRTASQSNWREQVDCRGRSTGRIGPAPTLNVTIARLDRAEVVVGGQFAADIRLTNTGTKPVVLPTARADEFGEGFARGPYAVQASLGLRVVGVKGREYTSAGAVLRGSPSRPGTVETVGPGESLTIHFPGWFLIVDDPATRVIADAELFATLILSDNDCRDWNAVSSRRVTIRFRGVLEQRTGIR
jgi:hypothetical protein